MSSYNPRPNSHDQLFAGYQWGDEEGMEYHHPDRIRQSVRQALADERAWLRPEYSCALHCVYLLGLLEANGIVFDGSLAAAVI